MSRSSRGERSRMLASAGVLTGLLIGGGLWWSMPSTSHLGREGFETGEIGGGSQVLDDRIVSYKWVNPSKSLWGGIAFLLVKSGAWTILLGLGMGALLAAGLRLGEAYGPEGVGIGDLFEEEGGLLFLAIAIFLFLILAGTGLEDLGCLAPFGLGLTIAAAAMVYLVGLRLGEAIRRR